MGIIDNTRYEVLTEAGFKDFSGIKLTYTDSTILIKFEDETNIECTENHLFKMNGEFVSANTLLVGDILNSKIISSIEYIAENKPVYDLLDVKDTSSYLTNDITSHNCAFLINWDEFFASVYPTISSGKETKILLTSTPNSLNHFWKICKEAQEDIDENGKGKNGYIYIEVAWDRVPGRDEAWKEDTLASIGQNHEQFNQEFNVSFIGSQSTLISGQTLQNLSYLTPLVEREGIKQYAQPRIDGTYVMTVDVSRGKGLDYSTFTVFDCTKMPYTQACIFRDNYIGPIDFASIIYRIGKLYNEASILVEINDIGGQVADTLLLDYGYENMLFTENAGRAGKRISAGFGGKQNDPGIRTTKSVKAIGCSILKLLIEQNQLILTDFDTIQELSRFSRKSGSYEAESGFHDDMVINLVHFAWLTDQTYFKDITDINTLSRLREKTEEQIEEDLLPFGFIDIGMEDSDDTSLGIRATSW